MRRRQFLQCAPSVERSTGSARFRNQGSIFQSFGWNNSPFVLQKEKGEYTWKDMARQCRKYGVPWRMPSQFPRLGVPPLRVVRVGRGQSWVGTFAKEVMLLNFSLDRDINSNEEISNVLRRLGLAADDAPTFFVRNEMFWGNDRLEDAVDLALGRMTG